MAMDQPLAQPVNNDYRDEQEGRTSAVSPTDNRGTKDHTAMDSNYCYLLDYIAVFHYCQINKARCDQEFDRCFETNLFRERINEFQLRETINTDCIGPFFHAFVPDVARKRALETEI